MKSKIAVLALALLLAGCASFTTQVFRVEQTATQLVFDSYVVYTNALHSGVITVTPAQSNAVKQARLQFAGTVGVVESLRSSYETNSAVKPQIQAALQTLASESSNIVWLVTYLKTK